MYTLLMIISLLAGLVLIAAVLIQPGKGDMTSAMGGSVGGQFGSMIGMRRAADFLVKATLVLAGGLMVFALITNLFALPNRSGNNSNAPMMQGMEAPPVSAPPPASAPASQPSTQPAQSQPAQTQPAQTQPAGK
jgi:protein translocase SecG subunit